MNSSRPAWRPGARIPGIISLLLLAALSVSTSTRVAEKDELASVLRQLDQMQASLERARVAATQADPAERGRFFFDYRRR
ncbi:hypothetical protein FEM41_20925 [Jejubacter calystegiae]|uniref:Uncharacterized protein n=1 Tax=Jejubacter calystegiae TaxID=2579935 RepID=A0A4P8YPL0_9ENTR|nr:hypothetical protein FEM41_20925 [Jejubacter calystegiae]